MIIFVTGANGFVGPHLVAALRQDTTAEVFTTGHGVSEASEAISLDLLDYEQVETVLADIRPDRIYHLAAFSSPALSFKSPTAAINHTLAMQINLYEACLRLNISPKFIIISSGQIYGAAESQKDLPLSESSKVHFSSPYSVAKVGQENLTSMYRERGFESIIARPFNHIGPDQQSGFLITDLAQQVVAKERGEVGPLMVGNLTSKRDFTDVRDIVRAYVMLGEHGLSGEAYNICSGTSVAGQDILDALLDISGHQITVEQDPDRLRPSDIPDLYGDATKLNTATGWKPRIMLRHTLKDVLEDWRRKAA